MLKGIVEKKYGAVAAAKAERPLAKLMPKIVPGQHVFRQALKGSGWSLIAECKLASPAKGIFAAGRKVADLAAIYGENGATALSVLTDMHFKGSLADLAAARKVCKLPILRKDFVVDVYQLYEARAYQADAVLLIAAVLADDLLQECLTVAAELGLDCLVEVHTSEELARVIKLPVEIIGINNRDLTTFKTNIVTTQELMKQCRPEQLLISESGVRSAADAELLKSWGVNGILVGEGLVTAPDIAAMTRALALQEK